MLHPSLQSVSNGDPTTQCELGQTAYAGASASFLRTSLAVEPLSCALRFLASSLGVIAIAIVARRPCVGRCETLRPAYSCNWWRISSAKLKCGGATSRLLSRSGATCISVDDGVGVDGFQCPRMGGDDYICSLPSVVTARSHAFT